MNARVFLLALFTATFMAIWDADRPTSIAADQSRAPQDITTAPDSASATAVIDVSIPLPKKLHPGIWQAHSREGETFRITIERSSRLSDSMSNDAWLLASPGKNVCIMTAPDGIRWCFIKELPKTAQHSGAVQN